MGSEETAALFLGQHEESPCTGVDSAVKVGRLSQYVTLQTNRQDKALCVLAS